MLRLLLRQDQPPNRILCLTFTKAAAAEMTIRVFETLGEWVTLDDAALTDDADTDAGAFDGTGIAVALADVAGAATRTIRFKVRIQ